MELYEREKTMVFMKCVRRVDSGVEYFVGESKEALYEGTEDGRRYALLSYKSHELLGNEHVIPSSKMRRFQEGVDAVKSGQPLFWIGIAP